MRFVLRVAGVRNLLIFGDFHFGTPVVLAALADSPPTPMNDRWNQMSIGERIVLSAWMAVREHMSAKDQNFNVQRSTINDQRPETDLAFERWQLNVENWTLNPDRDDNADYPQGADL